MEMEEVRPAFQISSRLGTIGLCVRIVSQVEDTEKSPRRDKDHLGMSGPPEMIGVFRIFIMMC